MRKTFLFLTGLLLFWSPVLFIDPVHQNITALQFRILPLYLLWGVSLLYLLIRLYGAGWWTVLLAAGFLAPWIPDAGNLNDLHVWLQIAGIVWLSCLQLRSCLYAPEKKARTWFLVLGISFTVMAVCGHVSGLSEMVFASGLLVFWFLQTRKPSVPVSS